MAKRKYYRHQDGVGSIPINKKRKYHAWRKRSFSAYLRLFFKLSLIGIASLFFVILLAFIYYTKDLPNPQEVLNKPFDQSTKIYARDEKTLLYEVFNGGKRTVVGIENISPYVINATIAIEDNNFYKHPGIDFRGILRSAWIAVKTGGQYVQGASTITQQFVRNSLLTLDRTISRKLKEIILSLELERRYTKNDILAFYLNQIPYGSNTYGVESASRAFFGKSVKDVTLGEAAILAAIPKAPSKYSPYGTNPELLLGRQKLVLKRMKDLGYITEKEMTDALAEKIEFQKQKTGFKAPHFVMYIKEQLEAKYGKDVIETGGLHVYTTLDWDLQQKAEEIVSKNGVQNEKEFGAKNAALVAIDPRTGEILSMVGSRDYFDTENDGNVNVALRPRQPGSAFKPFAYSTAFAKGYTPDTILYDVKTEFNPYCLSSAVQAKDQFGLDCYHPNNYDNNERGPLTMRSALAQSLNIPSVKTLYLAGIDDTIALAKKMGISTLEDRSRFGLALVLGGGEVKLLELTSAYGIFATEGLKNNYYSIVRVEDGKGNILEEYKPEQPERVLDQNVSRLITDVLSDNNARAPIFGTASSLYFGDTPVAAKTGTTQDYRDGWTIGYTPNFVAGVWTGNNDNSSMGKTAGIRTAGLIWHEFMLEALKNREKTSFNPPTIAVPDKPVLRGVVGGETVKIDTVSGKRATDLTPPELIEEKTFLKAHCILYYVNKDDPQGPAPTNPADDPQFNNWEQAVRSWAQDPARGNLVEEIPPQEFDNIHTLENKPILEILSPGNGDTLRSDTVRISADVRANYPIKEVDFFFDDIFLGSKVSSPYDWSFKPSGDQLLGRHKITVKAYDIYLNSSAKSINITTDIGNISDSSEATGTIIIP
ncbi:MAG: PBP1A family penicillin-binding protein [Candidatus Paceibacterota bacterium]|jgi:1A family penicillin-binding protein